jgi:hypothetical protein
MSRSRRSPETTTLPNFEIELGAVRHRGAGLAAQREGTISCTA